MEIQNLGNTELFEQKNYKFRIIIILISIIVVLLILNIIFIILYINVKSGKNSNDKQNDIPFPSLWNDCEAKTKLTEFMKNISKENVTKEDKIAVFDLDGTLFQETDLVYDDWKIYYYRVFNDTNFNASDEQKEIAKLIDKSGKEGTMPDDLNMKIATTYMELFENMTLEEYDKYLKDFVNKPAEGYENLKRGDAFYKPMIELIEYLQKNEFNIYITSGTDRFQVRSVIEGHIKIPKSNVIGSDYDVVTNNQGNIKGNEYEYKKDDNFIFNGKFLNKNLKTNKIVGIIKEIGKQPLLAFGNSGGDGSMANYVINNNKYSSLSFMVLCDDTERERGNKEKAEKMKNSCKENGWIPISMKNDWKTIYGENVKKKVIT